MEWNFKTIGPIVAGVVLIGVISGAALFPMLGSSLFDFGEESGLIVLLETKPSPFGLYYENDVVDFEVVVYELKDGEFVSNTASNPDLRQDLNFTYSIKPDGVEEFILIDFGQGKDEITLSSLKSRSYKLKASVEGISKEYTILNPFAYLTVAQSLLPTDRYAFDELLFSIEPFGGLQSWITSPRSHVSAVEGGVVMFNSMVKRNLNYTLYYEITDHYSSSFNNASNFVSSSQLITMLEDNLPNNIPMSELVQEISPTPYNPEFLYTTDNATFQWYDEYIDESGSWHPPTLISNEEYFHKADFPIGEHVITLLVNDKTTGLSTSSKVDFWIVGKEQPTVPVMYEFQFPEVVTDGSVFVDWSNSFSNNPNSAIDHYELQIGENSHSFHSGTTTPYVEGVDYIHIPANKSYQMLKNLPSSTNKSVFHDGKYWFRVRAVDSLGQVSLWSNVEGVAVDQAPTNIYVGGIFLDNGTRVDQHNETYVSFNGLIDEGRKTSYSTQGYGLEEDDLPEIIFDFYPGHFENSSANSYYDGLDLTDGFVYQYQDFTIKLQSTTGETDEQNKNNETIDPDELDSDLTYLVYSTIDGLIYKGDDWGPIGATISYKDHIAPFIRIKNLDSYSRLTAGVHEIVAVVKDTAGVLYVLPALVLEVRTISPSWSSTPESIPEFYLDATGDGRVDWGKFGFRWDYPQFNSFMPTFPSEGSEGWEILADKVKYWEIELTHQYGNTTTTEVIRQYSPEPFHYWSSTSMVDEDYITLNDFITGNYSFRVRVCDRDYLFSDWSNSTLMLDLYSNVLPSPYQSTWPVLTNADNPEPNLVINEEWSFSDSVPNLYPNTTFVLDASNSSDLNGDNLVFTWSFDGVVRTDIPSFDPHSEVLVINPEWLGNDENPGVNETDLIDGDDYGDWGVHTIQLDLTDGNTVISWSLEVSLVPRNTIPTISGVAKENYHSQPEYGIYVYDFEELLLYPTDLTHIDHELTPQNITVEYYARPDDGGNEIFLGIRTVGRDLFIQYDNTIPLTVSRTNAGIRASLMEGNYTIEVVVSDGYSQVNSSTTILVRQNQIPQDLTLKLCDQDGYELHYNGSGYLMVWNQIVNFRLNWTDDESDEGATISLIDTPDGPIFDGPASRYFSSTSVNFVFNTTGLHTLSLAVRDVYGGIANATVQVFVLVVELFPLDNADSVANELSYTVGGESYINYGKAERSLNYVPNPLSAINHGDSKAPSSYPLFTNSYNLTEIYIPGAKYIRVWFKIQYAFDFLYFSSSDGGVRWVVTRDNFGKYLFHGFVDDDYSQGDLPKLHVGDMPQNFTDASYSWNVPYGERLYSVLLPGDTVNMQVEFTTKPCVVALNTLGCHIANRINSGAYLWGFKIAYYEYIGDGPVQRVDPGNIDDSAITDNLGGDDAGLLTDPVMSAFNALQEEAGDEDSDWNSECTGGECLKISVQKEFEWECGVTLTLQASFNLLTTDLEIEAEIGWEVTKTRVGKKILKAIHMDKLVIGGGFKITVRLSPFQLRELSIFFFIEATKQLGLLDILRAFPPTSAIANAISPANDWLEDHRLPHLPNLLEISIRIELRIGWSDEKGFFVRFTGSLKLSISFGNEDSEDIKESFLYAYIHGDIYVGWSMVEGFEFGVGFGVGAGVAINPRRLLDYSWVPDWDIFRFEYYNYWNLDFTD